LQFQCSKLAAEITNKILNVIHPFKNQQLKVICTLIHNFQDIKNSRLSWKSKTSFRKEEKEKKEKIVENA
jgi:hypothetical protein